MPTIAANASTQISLAAGNRLRFLPTGSGVAVVGPSSVASAGSTFTLGSEEAYIGPFDGPRTVSISAGRLLDYEVQVPPFDQYLSNGMQVVAQEPSTGALVAAGLGRRIDAPRRVLGVLGQEAFDLVGVTGLPAGASFSGSGTYNGLGVLAVQSTGTITHNPTGWYDGSPCIDFTPNTDSNAEFRVYIAAGVNISDDDGLGFEFGIPEDLDTSKSGFSISFDYSSDAVNAFPSNTAFMRVWLCNQTDASTKEKGGRKYIRNRWDATSASDEALCGAWPGNVNVGTLAGTGADRTALCRWIRFRVSQFSGKTVKFKRVRRGGRATPAFVLGSDNANPEDLFRAIAYASSKQLPTYLNQYISNLPFGSVQLERYQAAHNGAAVDICANDLVDRPLGSAVTAPAAMRAAVRGTKADLANRGFWRGSRVWIANNNSSSYLMIQELREAGYVANRNGDTDGRYVFTEGGVPDAYRLPARSIDNMNWTAIQVLIDRGITYGASLWLYWHGVLSTARMDADRAANVTGTAGAPIARSGTESLAQYRARALALGTAAGTASVAYFDARIGTASLGIWWEELKPMLDYLATKDKDGSCAVVGAEQWCRDVGLILA